jgi:ABC-type Fe3+-siderophore transport system permease subunit
MMVHDNTLAVLRQLGVAINLAATLVVVWYSFLFGQQLGGPFMGVVAAVNGAAMCSLLISGLVDWLTGESER